MLPFTARWKVSNETVIVLDFPNVVNAIVIRPGGQMIVVDIEDLVAIPAMHFPMPNVDDFWGRPKDVPDDWDPRASKRMA